MKLVDKLRELKEAVAIRHWRNDVKTLDAAIARIEAGDALADATGWNEAQDPGYAKWRALVREQDAE